MKLKTLWINTPKRGHRLVPAGIFQDADTAPLDRHERLAVWREKVKLIAFMKGEQHG